MQRQKRLAFNFATDSSTSPFAISQQAYLIQHADKTFQYIATAAVVFDTQEELRPRVLLLQRSGEDSMPNKWEVPGGACDDDDESILYGAARELWEETGLKAIHFKRVVGNPHFFTSKSGKKICKFVFMVEAEKNAEGQLVVTLDPKEHQRYKWATLEEIRAKKLGDIELDFTMHDLENTVCQSFQYIEETRA